MLLLPPLRRRAEDFARALDAGFAPDPTAASLFTLADELAAMPFGPDAAFRGRLRQRLVTLAADPPPQVVRPRLADQLDELLTGWRAQRRLAFAAGMLAVALVVAGVGLLGSRSVPGEPFYGVKRAAESVQLATAHGKLTRGNRHLDFAATRLREVSALVDRNSALVAGGSGRAVAGRLALSARTTELVLDTLSDMDRETLAGTRDLTEYWRESGQSRPLQALDDFATGQHAALAAVVPTLPMSARAPGLQALALISSVSDRAQALIEQGPCDASCRAVAGGATMSGGFDVLGPLPCPDVCPGSGAAQAPAATVTSAPSIPAASYSPLPVLPTVDPTVSPSQTSAPEPSPPSWTDPPLPSLSPSPLPSLSPLPSPVESAPPSSPTPTTSPSPVSTTEPPLPPNPSPTETASASESPSPSPPDPTATGSPTPLAASPPLPPVPDPPG